eukprot:TRINITY_DN11552_c0_g1_i2.p2 TRINITY_DN11552_c0_g1~~TRINITY_DN11552_c0_g1_i2.p2  ORF type:complete len:158 (+),score=10.70 TRINITY_DN11552_c0_g1_i2:329-802(+)
MDYAPHGDVQRRIDRARQTRQAIPLMKIMSWIGQTVEALHYLHSQGIIHRDVKAANLFLNECESVLLGDFGVARVLDENAKRLSARTCQTPVGTPMYLSPEQAKGDKYGQSVDIWALGCLLYELIQLKPGRGLFQRITNDSMIKVSQLSQEDQWQAC